MNKSIGLILCLFVPFGQYVLDKYVWDIRHADTNNMFWTSMIMTSAWIFMLSQLAQLVETYTIDQDIR